MLLSLCTPVMNRTDDLRRTMPARMAAALQSPPVQFVILDYNSKDDLEEYVTNLELPREIGLLYMRYTGRAHYHQAHAYNLAILAGAGEYFGLMGADTFPQPGYFSRVRELIAEGYVWIEDKRYKGAIICERQEFINAGGYDERFEFYGPEDRELAVRLTRRGGKKGTLPAGLIGNYFTPDAVKVANYQIKDNKRALSQMMRPIFEQNVNAYALTVNPQGWGKWN